MWQHAAVIVNPNAGNRKAEHLWPEVERRLRRAGFQFEAFFTANPGHAISIAQSISPAQFDVVIAMGGDGTVNEVANGLLASGPSVLPLGIISCGSGCDFVRTLGIPKGAQAVEALTSDRTFRIDVGKVQFRQTGGAEVERYFVNAADLGLGAEVAEKVNRNGKALGGFASFLSSAVVTLVGARFKTVEYVIDRDVSKIARAGIIFIANGQFAGGGMHFAPQAKLDDGLFDVVLLREVGKPVLLGDLLPRVYRGTHLDHPSVIHCQAQEVSVSALEPLLLEIDGEQPGSAPAHFSIVPQALRIVIPDAQS